MSVIATPGSLVTMMDELVAVENTIDPQLRVYRWQPIAPQLPAVWNWMTGSGFQQMDLARWRDVVNVTVSIGIAHTDDNQDMADIEYYADRARAVLDHEFRSNHRPLNDTATKGWRTSMSMGTQEFNGVPVLCIQFPLELRLDRHVQ